MNSNQLNEKIEVTRKEEIEKHLLSAMNSLDKAMYVVPEWEKDKYHVEIQKLLQAKREIKSILNKHFDKLARQNNSQKL